MLKNKIFMYIGLFLFAVIVILIMVVVPLFFEWFSGEMGNMVFFSHLMALILGALLGMILLRFMPNIISFSKKFLNKK